MRVQCTHLSGSRWSRIVRSMLRDTLRSLQIRNQRRKRRVLLLQDNRRRIESQTDARAAQTNLWSISVHRPSSHLVCFGVRGYFLFLLLNRNKEISLFLFSFSFFQFGFLLYFLCFSSPFLPRIISKSTIFLACSERTRQTTFINSFNYTKNHRICATSSYRNVSLSLDYGLSRSFLNRKEDTWKLHNYWYVQKVLMDYVVIFVFSLFLF